jgi:hypothetical protein
MPGVLIRRPVLDAIAAGTVTVAFRRWDRARVHKGSRLRTAVGVLEVGEVTTVAEEELGEPDARAAGFTDLAALRRRLAGEKPIFRVTLRLAGPDPRVELRSRAALDDADRAELDRRLGRLDRSSRRGPWTNQVLALIADNPEVRAPDLAARLGLETVVFKRDVRKLKELGLTESLPIGYRLSARGQAYRATPPA